MSYFLGIEATRTTAGLHLTQRKYIKERLEQQGMENCKPVFTPLPTTTKLSKHSRVSFADPEHYRQAVDALQYATMTRPDLAFTVNKVCQFMYSRTDDIGLL